MAINKGTKFQISQEIKSNFNSADAFTVISNDGSIVQFTLADGKGHGAMPLQHLDYLVKKANLTQIPNRRSLLSNEINGEQIG